MHIRDRIKELRRVPASQLRRNPHAWRKHSNRQRKALEDVLQEIGYAGALLARETDEGLELIDGQLRADITPEQDVPVLVLDVTAEEALTVLATSDPLAAMAEADGPKLKQLLEEAIIPGEGLAEYLNDLARAALRKLDPEAVVDVDPQSLAEQTITRPGDLWLLGEHRLLCGDATNPADIARLMDGQLADLLLTDPPYGVNYVGKTEQALTIRNDGAEGLAALLESSLTLALKHTKLGGVWYVSAPAGPQFLDFAKILTALKVWRQTLVWVKDTMVLGRSDYHYRHEPIFAGEVPDSATEKEYAALLYGWRPGAKHCAPADRTWSTVLEYPKPRASHEHPTMKPVELWADLMRNSTAAGDVVLDLFGGSGTTAVVAEQLKRRSRLMELDERYCDVICKRWKKLTGIAPVRESDGLRFSEVRS